MRCCRDWMSRAPLGERCTVPGRLCPAETAAAAPVFGRVPLLLSKDGGQTAPGKDAEVRTPEDAVVDGGEGEGEAEDRGGRGRASQSNAELEDSAPRLILGSMGAVPRRASAR